MSRGLRILQLLYSAWSLCRSKPHFAYTSFLLCSCMFSLYSSSCSAFSEYSFQTLKMAFCRDYYVQWRPFFLTFELIEKIKMIEMGFIQRSNECPQVFQDWNGGNIQLGDNFWTMSETDLSLHWHVFFDLNINNILFQSIVHLLVWVNQVHFANFQHFEV